MQKVDRQMINKQCFIVVVDKSWYEGFVPFYIYFCNRAYPTCDVLVFFRGMLDTKTKNTIKTLGCKNYCLKENWNTDYQKGAHVTKALRWVISEDELGTYDHAYIGDVDIMIAKEKENLFDKHLKHAALLELPYSNMIRPEKERVSGLHFIKTKSYFDKTKDKIKEVKKQMKQQGQSYVLSFKGKNEGVLYYILKESGLLNNLLLSSNELKYRPHHGVHLGCFRNRSSYKFDPQNYFDDLRDACEENKILKKCIEESNFKIKNSFRRALVWQPQTA
jgi:hypothetical protein